MYFSRHLPKESKRQDQHPPTGLRQVEILKQQTIAPGWVDWSIFRSFFGRSRPIFSLPQLGVLLFDKKGFAEFRVVVSESGGNAAFFFSAVFTMTSSRTDPLQVGLEETSEVWLKHHG